MKKKNYHSLFFQKQDGILINMHGLVQTSAKQKEDYKFICFKFVPHLEITIKWKD